MGAPKAFGGIGASFLHDGQGDDLRVGHAHLTGSSAEPNPVGGYLGAEVVGIPVENQEQLFGRRGRVRHNSRSVGSG